MSTSMYSRSKQKRNLAALLLAVMLISACYKCYASWLKADLYGQAAKAQAEGHELEAETLYLRARDNTSIRYKNHEIDEALNKLRPATELKRTLASISDKIRAAAAVNDVPTLLKAYESFQSAKADYAGMDDTAQKRFADAEAVYRIDEGLAQSFADVLARLEQSLEKSSTNKTFDNNNSIQYLLQIPAIYYKDEKTKKQQLNDRFKAYDQARMDSLFKTKSFLEVVNETTLIRKFYNANGVQAEWLVPMLETYAQNTLASLLKKNDLSTFISYANKVQETTKELADSRSKINTYIQTSIKAQFTRAEKLVATKKYAESIELYTILNSYKDTSKEIRDTEQRWLEADPVQLLRKAMNTSTDAPFTNVINGKSLWGSKMASVGLTGSSSLAVARLMPDEQLDYVESALSKQISVKSVKLSDSLSSSDQPAIVVEAAAKTRKARYIVFAYDVKSKELRTILDVEGDSFTPDRSRPGVLIVDNPAGEAEGQQAYYEYRGGQYTVVKVKSDVLDITLSELPKQKPGAIVRFQCQIMSLDGNTAIVALGNDYVQLSGNVRFKTGSAVVTGTFVEKNKVTFGQGQSSGKGTGQNKEAGSGVETGTSTGSASGASGNNGKEPGGAATEAQVVTAYKIAVTDLSQGDAASSDNAANRRLQP
ncbi:hypothetical protein [Paenibacillus sp. N3.4]|uniref:hypothetical protein n=1 Tax=Paenibacillus sp. N3.4 TaxID=2603222 RepID=UPI0011C8895D|nr:hypothetical protein [Paenibacillus sp. N3.4]TXK83788.1 hypothetical protein FU659_11905 [Paenibacillus sp. N3.4]